MNTEISRMKHQELTRRIIGAFFDVYNELGHGFLESVYVEALDLALKESGLTVIREMPLRVHFRNTVVGVFRADLVVAGAVLVEVKACQCLNASHKAQALNYLRATVLEVGLILNFGPQPVVKRLLFDNPLKTTKRKVSVSGPGASTAAGTIRINQI
jgi:GxxExxY protein